MRVRSLPQPPATALLVSLYDDTPVEFYGNSSYVCAGEELYFEWDRDMAEFNVTCQEDGSWAAPAADQWPSCLPCEGNYFFELLNIFSLPAVNCSEPPSRPAAGTWEWDGGLEYETQISFTCGPYGSFPDTEVVVATCGWDKTWTPAQLPPCVCRSAVV